MNAIDVLKKLQDHCTSHGETIVFEADGRIIIGTRGSVLRATPTTTIAHVGLEAANDNKPLGSVTLDAPGYESLAQVLARAFDDASNGKGHERHANALPFHKQPMQTICGQVGAGFVLGQAIKKVQESQCLPAGRDTKELLGAINYIAGAVIFLESQHHPANDDNG